GNYELCLSKAAKAKAASDVLLGSLGVEAEGVDALVARKLLAAGRVISRQASKGVFPIVGYSYYEYAKSLNDSDPYSALLYSEYAIELSNMDMYFRKSAKPEQAVKSTWLPSGNYASFALGAIAGAAFTLIVLSAVFAVRRLSARTHVIKRKRRIVKKAAVRRQIS
ncbi:hypothetical protein HYV82_06575, partial [Candidatus Woesearchaeota archaeon]|nr:hypothetical protein [Candidatus Woesearchaeota archaeon]